MIIEIAGGSIIGTDHLKPGQPGSTNNHDSFTWKQNNDILVAVVTDGCGSGKHSEVGSKVASSILSQTLFDEINRLLQFRNEILLEDSFWKRIKTRFIAKISVLAESMGSSISNIVNNYFLFTLIGLVVIHGKAYIFSCGDGVYIVNGEMRELGPFEKNAPPYIMYNLTGTSLFENSPHLLDIQINEILEPENYDNILFGTDGVLDLISISERFIPNTNQTVGSICQFWEEDKYFSNPDMTRRRLAVLNKERISEGKIVGGLLPDDTTFIVIRKQN